jgi:hypothetical protein
VVVKERTDDFYRKRRWVVLEFQVVPPETRDMGLEEMVPYSNGIQVEFAFRFLRLIIEKLLGDVQR